MQTHAREKLKSRTKKKHTAPQAIGSNKKARKHAKWTGTITNRSRFHWFYFSRMKVNWIQIYWITSKAYTTINLRAIQVRHSTHLHTRTKESANTTTILAYIVSLTFYTFYIEQSNWLWCVRPFFRHCRCRTFSLVSLYHCCWIFELIRYSRIVIAMEIITVKNCLSHIITRFG